jgi:hypothetical protein
MGELPPIPAAAPKNAQRETRDRLAEVPRQQMLLQRSQLLKDIVTGDKFPVPKTHAYQGEYLRRHLEIGGRKDDVIRSARQIHRLIQATKADDAPGLQDCETQLTDLLRRVHDYVAEVEKFDDDYDLRGEFLEIRVQTNVTTLRPGAQDLMRKMGIVMTSTQLRLNGGDETGIVKPEHLAALRSCYELLRDTYTRPPLDVPPRFQDLLRTLQARADIALLDVEEVLSPLLGQGENPDLKPIVEAIQTNRAKIDGKVGTCKRAFDLLARNIAFAQRDPEGYDKKMSEVETRYLQRMGLQGVSAAEFRTHIRELHKPPTPVPKPGDADFAQFKEQDIAYLKGQHTKFTDRQKTFVAHVDDNLFTLQLGGAVPPADYDNILNEMISLTITRETYERMRNPRVPRPPDTLLMKVGIFVEAIADNYAMMAGPEAATTGVFALRREFELLPRATQSEIFALMERSLFKEGYLLIDDAAMVLRNPRMLEGIARMALGKGVPVVVGHTATAAEVARLTEALQKAGLSDRLIVQGLEGMGGLDMATRNALLRGIKEAQTMLNRSVTTEEFAMLLKNVKFEGGMGGLAKDVMHMCTPGMYILFAIYMHQTDNKIEGAMMLMGFLGAGMAIDGVLIDRMLIRGAPALLRLFAPAAAERLLVGLRGVPGYVKLIIVLLICFKFEKDFSDVIKKAESALPANQIGYALQTVLRGVFLDPAFELIDQGLFRTGVKTVNPERDWMKHMGRETLTTSGTDYFLNTGNWNADVDRAIAGERSQVLQEKWKLEKIDDAWLKRQAVDLNSKVGAMRGLGREIRTAVTSGNLRSYDERADKIEDKPDEKTKALQEKLTPERLDRAFACMLAVATGDGSDRYRRNDLELEWTLAKRVLDVSLSWNLDPRADDVLEVRRGMESLPDDHPLRQSWNVYLMNARTTARTVSLLRHMKWSEQRDGRQVLTSLYDPSKMIQREGETGFPPYLREGMVEKVKYAIARRKVDNQVNFNRTRNAVDAVPNAGPPPVPFPEGRNPRVRD